jgi:hypothetical protein
LQQNLSLSRARKNSSAWSIPSSTHSRSTRSFCALTSSFHVLGFGAAGLAELRFVIMFHCKQVSLGTKYLVSLHASPEIRQMAYWYPVATS